MVKIMTISNLVDNLKTIKSALIFTHTRPDGDTVGSAIALKNALIQLGIDVDVVCDISVPQKFHILNGADSFLNLEQVNKKYDAHIAVDCSSRFMFGSSYDLFLSSKNTFNIDHHISNDRYAKYNYVVESGANTENIYEIITALSATITKDIADAILLGIITDTGSFAHSNVTPNTLSISAKMLACGGDLHNIIYKMFKEQSPERAKLYSKITSKMQYFLDGQVGVLVIEKKDLQECDANDTMTEGFIDFPLTVRTVEVAISLLETGKNQYKISLRSKGRVNVNEIASIYGGGGHILASGARINGYKEDVIDKLVYNVKQRL